MDQTTVPSAVHAPGGAPKRRKGPRLGVILGAAVMAVAILVVGLLAQIRDPRVVGRLLDKKGMPEAALVAYEWATTSFPDKPWAWLDLSAAQQRLGREAEASASALRAVSVTGAEGEEPLEVGFRLLAMNRYDLAAQTFERAALGAARPPVEALDKLVYTLVKLDRPEDAAKAIDRAAARGLEGDLATNVEGARAILAALTGEADSARAQAAALTAAHPESPVARLQAAQVHAILAEKEAAVKELEAIPAMLPFPHPCWFEKELRTPTLASVKDHPRYAQVAERSKDWRRKPSR